MPISIKLKFYKMSDRLTAQSQEWDDLRAYDPYDIHPSACVDIPDYGMKEAFVSERQRQEQEQPEIEAVEQKKVANKNDNTQAQGLQGATEAQIIKAP